MEKIIIKVDIKSGQILIDNRETLHWTYQQQLEMRDANYFDPKYRERKEGA